MKNKTKAILKIYNRYKSSAKRRNLVFDADFELFEHLIQRKCEYCGSEPDKTKVLNNRSKILRYGGIDRIDSGAGYIDGNIISCCWRCNASKNNMSLKEFKLWIEKVYNHTRTNTILNGDSIHEEE